MYQEKGTELMTKTNDYDAFSHSAFDGQNIHAQPAGYAYPENQLHPQQYQQEITQS